ncbi:hypothetical protein [Bernardetia sp. MNP-M8]|uniref:AbiJ-NTD4 domain-containing protein n=1 Tax=Bernardetia sp. MNP-M8 TaxID=3127470 RepID=UPI0030CAA726
MNRRFSERMGIVKPRLDLQINDIDERLKNRLWNIFLKKVTYERFLYGTDDPKTLYYHFMENFWGEFLLLPLDEIPVLGNNDYKAKIRANLKEFFFQTSWYEIYELLEFYLPYKIDGFASQINEALEKEMSGYRIVNNLVTPITSQEEINEVEEAAQSPYNSVNEHLKTAIQLFSDRENPDYRNSIKEAISAVESLCCIIAEDNKATFGKALAKTERKLNLGVEFKTAINSLYGYTNNEGGIRHKLFEGSQEIKFEDAKFMLVSCSAFINYLIAKNV